MAVKGPNHQMRTRIRGLTVLFALIGFGLVGVRLLYMQVFNHDFYVQQATALQTRDTFITPNRGKIYDANMQVLAESAAVERITISPKAVVDEDKVKKGISAETQQQTLAQILSETLDVDYDTVMAKIQKTNSQYEIIAQKVDKDVSKELDEKLEAADCTGVYSEPDTKRYYQHGAFLSAVLGYVGSDNNGAYGLESEYNDELAGTAGRLVRVQNRAEHGYHARDPAVHPGDRRQFSCADHRQRYPELSGKAPRDRTCRQSGGARRRFRHRHERQDR